MMCACVYVPPTHTHTHVCHRAHMAVRGQLHVSPRLPSHLRQGVLCLLLLAILCLSFVCSSGIMGVYYHARLDVDSGFNQVFTLAWQGQARALPTESSALVPAS